jgi:protocatechuate 3,4-dioxygenase beta subunit
MDDHRTTRRRLLHISGSAFLQLSLIAPAVFITQKSWAQRSVSPVCGRPTLPQIAGPFFMPQSPERSSLIENGMTASRMRLRGQVLDKGCKPVPGALIDFWQCDDKGEYDNQGYRLRGHQFTNNVGQFVLDTLVPGAYPGRTPHLHVRVQRKGSPVLTTQLYLPGRSSNSGDFLFDPRLLIEARGQDYFFSFVLLG